MKIIGVLLILLGLFLGVYFGLYLMFIGGIMQVITAVKSTPVETSLLIWGIVKIIFAKFVAITCLAFPCAFGWALIKEN